jgi:GT2 family glycosyltransferase
MGKIGVAIISKDRENYFKQCLKSVDLNAIDHLVVVNDGNEFSDFLLKSLHHPKIKYIKNEKNLGVSKTKNKGLRYLLNKECEHIFVLEDDCIITDNSVWGKYIKTYEVTGMPHFNFGPGSPWNRKQNDPSVIGNLDKRHLASQTTDPNPKLIIDYGGDTKIALYEHIVAMFVYFHSSILDKVGLLNEEFYNAWEHVSHTYDIIKAGYYSPFWWFADVADSQNFIKEAENEKANTSLAKNKEQYMKNVYDGLDVFRKIHGTIPGLIRPATKEEVIETIKRIKKL